MPDTASDDLARVYARDGFAFPFRAMQATEAADYRRRLEATEASLGGPLKSNMRQKVHLLLTWAAELVRHPAILDQVERIIGPDILCWNTNLFIKEPHDPAFVSWHQDSTYWGLDPADVVTAWLAISDAPVESGAMRFLSGSHGSQIAHRDTFDADNLLSRGQVADLEIDEARAVDVPLKAGEFSLHHIRLMHGSKPNTTGDRRIGLAIRYLPPHVRPERSANAATLVRGEDRFGHFRHEPAPAADLDEAALSAHGQSMNAHIGAIYQGTGITRARD
ncbi:MAG: phytanoyl-CoA dioxygenase family protein [Minwuia sp.]|uniref:phytanoyl-CoA dioxygenase family protein n=1 Tax=Minwuia sp. TaxID=2493630 RepID=UPI003A836A37